MVVAVIVLVNLFATATFIHLFVLMRKRHFFEFQKSKNLMLTMFITMTVLIAGFLYIVARDVIGGLSVDFSIWITKRSDRPFQKLEAYFCWIMQVPSIFSCLAIIELKGTKDCLQGIAKLDYLFKVSMFQRYRDSDLE